MEKPPMRFRAITSPKGLLVQSSRGGDVWTPGLDGLEAGDVRRQFERLERRGCVIVNTEDYKHESRTKK